MADDEMTVSSLADHVPAEGRAAPRPLTEFLAELDTERAPGDAGGVPVPETWRCVRAVLGGASRADLEAAHAPVPSIGPDMGGKEADDRITRRAEDGTHLPPGLHIVTGQTGGGKSALVVNLAHAAIGAGHPVLYVSLELDGGEIAARLLALETGLPWGPLALHRAMSEDNRRKRNAGIAALAERGARVAVLAPDEPLELTDIQTAARQLWRAHGRRPPLVVFDYLQAAAMLGTVDDWRLPLREHIGRVTMELRHLSRAAAATAEDPEWHGCPVVVLSTTARGNVRGDGAAPGLDGTDPDALRKADLETLKALPKEAGEIEATAVTAWVMALGEQETTGTRPLTLRLVKNRLGPPGQWIPFTFRGATGELKEASERYAEAVQADRDAAAKRETRNGTKPDRIQVLD